MFHHKNRERKCQNRRDVINVRDQTTKYFYISQHILAQI